MANLNFQQPPRSLANSALNNRGGASVGSAFAGANSISGHVTPTSGMFQPNNAGFGPQPQLSPNRSAQLGGVYSNQPLAPNNNANTNQQGRANLFGQRAMNDRRPMHGGLPPMVSTSIVVYCCSLEQMKLNRFLFHTIYSVRIVDGFVYASSSVRPKQQSAK